MERGIIMYFCIVFLRTLVLYLICIPLILVEILKGISKFCLILANIWEKGSLRLGEILNEALDDLERKVGLSEESE